MVWAFALTAWAGAITVNGILAYRRMSSLEKNVEEIVEYLSDK